MYNFEEGLGGPFGGNIMESLMRHVQYIDDIRRQKKMTVRTLCEGIINDRSYRRYLSGERNISQEKIFELCHRLGISPSTFFDSFKNRDSSEFTQLYKLYGHLRDKKFEQFIEEFDEINRKGLSSVTNQKFYDYLNIRYEMDIKKISLQEAYKRHSKIIDFPNCITHSVFDFSDIVVVFALSNIESRLNDREFKAAELLKRISLDESIRYLNSKGKYMMFAVYSALAVSYNTKEDWDECIRICEIGIPYALKYSNNSNLSNLYFVYGKALRMKGRIEEGNLELAKGLANTITQHNIEHYKFFTGLLKRLFDLDPEDLFKLIDNAYNQKET